jgi:hypothetical protein
MVEMEVKGVGSDKFVDLGITPKIPQTSVILSSWYGT